MVLNNEPPRLEGTHMVTGEEQGCQPSRTRQNDVDGSNLQGHLLTENSKHEKRRLRLISKTLIIGTWNFRSMNTGKLDVVKDEMERTGTDELRVSELK